MWYRFTWRTKKRGQSRVMGSLKCMALSPPIPQNKEQIETFCIKPSSILLRNTTYSPPEEFWPWLISWTSERALTLGQPPSSVASGPGSPLIRLSDGAGAAGQALFKPRSQRRVHSWGSPQWILWSPSMGALSRNPLKTLLDDTILNHLKNTSEPFKGVELDPRLRPQAYSSWGQARTTTSATTTGVKGLADLM